MEIAKENVITTNKNVFFNKNFKLVFFGALVSELGGTIYSFAVSFYILEITGNNAFLQGLYLAICGVFSLVFTPIGGVIGDRFNKGAIMFVCDYLRGGLILAATVMMFLFKDPGMHITALFIAGALGSAVGGIFSPAAGALFPHILEESRLQQANSYISLKSSLIGIVGVILAGVMYAALSIYALFLFVGICFVLSGVSEMFIRYAHRKSTEALSLKLVLSDMGDGVRYLKKEKAIIVLMFSILFINFFFVPITSNFLPYFIKTEVATAPSYLFDRYITPEFWTSIFSMIIGVSSLLSAAVISTRKQAEKCGRFIAGCISATAVMVIGLTVTYKIFVADARSLNIFLICFAAGAFVIGILLPCINIPIGTRLMCMVERDKLSKVSSITSVASQGLIPIATALAGVILQCFGSTLLLCACAVGFTITALFLLFNKQTGEF